MPSVATHQAVPLLEAVVGRPRRRVIVPVAELESATDAAGVDVERTTARALAVEDGGALALAAWCAAHLHWLYWANRLENNGDGVFPQIWLASALYFAVNVAVVAAVLLAYRREARVYI